MCGIAGIISNNKYEVSVQRLQKMTNAIQHRGPEGDGFWINNNGTVALGHRRLAIIDLSPAGAQPMHYSDRYTITYNGELYNYVELRDQLKTRKFDFKTDSDTEVILAAYACYGKDCLRHFDGMYAFAIWDEAERTLFAARDRFGEKPFYYVEEEDGFLFASEMKALWAAGVPKEMDNKMLLNYLTIGYTSDPTRPFDTFYNEVYTMPPGHYMELKVLSPSDIPSYEFEITSYWDIDKESKSAITDAQAIETFTHLFQTSVKRRLRSDVPLGTSLSGGLDSSSIVAIINQSSERKSHRQTAFSAIFPGFEKDESKQINAVSAKFNLESFHVTPTADGLVSDFKKLQYHQEEPFQSSSIYAQYKVYELAKQHGVTVLLDGQGADEILAGYHKYYHWYWQELIAVTKFSTFSNEIKAAKSIGVNVEWGLKNYVAAFFPGQTSEALKKRTYKGQRSHPAIDKDFFNTYNDDTSLEKPVVDRLNDILYYNTMQQGLQELLRYADRNSMAHSREVRLPFLNHELVQFIFSLPSNFKMRDGWTKWILRQAMTTILPDEITWRKDKTGFEPPQKTWMENKQLQDYIYESKKKLAARGILKKDVLDKQITPQAAHHAENFDWRYLSAAECL